MRRYLKTDVYRLISSKQFYIGIIGMAVLYYASGFQFGFQEICASYICTKMTSVAILSYAFCAIPFSGCYVEDEENLFWYLTVQRGSIKKYAWSKVLVCFVGAVLAMVIGTAIFVLVLHIQYPMVMEDGAVGVQLREVDAFGFLLHGNTAFWYFICSAGMNGLLGGIFALLSAYLSLYEKNRLFTICTPVIGYYFLENFLTDVLHMSNAVNLEVIFSSDLSLFNNTVWDVFYALIVALIVLIGIGTLTVRKIEREIHGIKM